MASEHILKMTFDPQTIEHLGVKMYSQIPNAIAELVANAYDADAKSVEIHLLENGKERSIKVVDDGIGMGFDEINEKFLRIGRNRREEGAKISPGGRSATGKKGLGKLALFGIGDLIEIVTIRESSGKKIIFQLNWDDLKKTSSGENYKPKFKEEACGKKEKGTRITLKKLRRQSSFDLEGLADSLSKLFNCFDKNFKCFVSLNDSKKININNELKFQNIDKEFEWSFPKFSGQVEHQYKNKDKIVGSVISAKMPLKTGQRGVILFANGRLVNAPEFFGLPESSHVFSYLTGWLNIDFIDDLKDDAISTNRQSLNWELPDVVSLKEFLIAALRKIAMEWRTKRAEVSKKDLATRAGIDTQKWFKTLPSEIRTEVEAIVQDIVDESEVPSEKQAGIVGRVHRLIPEYPYYHWRNLHPAIKQGSKDYYESRDYYSAVHESIKRYVNCVRKAINSTNTSDHSMMGEAFSISANKLNVTEKYKKPDGTNFNPETIENIRLGQKSFSESVVLSVRNPLAHEEYDDLKKSDLFSEKDCLDTLSLVSYIFRRLDDGIESSRNATKLTGTS